MSVLGIDVGTSSCKGLVLTQTGTLLAEYSRNYAQAVRLSGDRATLPAEHFRDSVFAVISKLAEETARQDPIEAIAFSTHGETLIPVGPDEQALTPAILSMDRRCIREAAQLERELGRSGFYKITGTPMHSQYPMPKIIWLKRNHREIADKTVRYCSAQDYLHGLLGAPGFVDYSLASRFGGLDVRKKAWSGDILDRVGITPDFLSQPVQAGTVIGRVDQAVARQLHLGEQVLLVAGGHDQPCASLGMGAQPQAVTVSAGSYECAALTTAMPLNTPLGEQYGLNSYCHVLKDQYITLAFFPSGLVVQWYIDHFCRYEKEIADRQGQDVHTLLETAMPKHPSGVCVTPHVFGAMNPQWNENARGSICGLSPLDDTASLYRAVLEGTACELDLNIRALERLAGNICQLTFSGGGTRSARWMQMRADILGKKLRCFEVQVDASSLGAAVLAGIGCGMFADVQTAWNAVNILLKEYLPDQNDYSGQKSAYAKLHHPDLFDPTKESCL